MNYSVIAIKENFQFKCVFCRFKEDLTPTLHKFHGSLSAAKCLVGLGDISLLKQGDVRSYTRDWGFHWTYTQPAKFDNRQALNDYVRAAGVCFMYLFEDNTWHTERFENDLLPAISFVA